MDCCDRRYKNVCLVIDDDITKQICTNTETGFDNQNSDRITWSIASSGMNIQILIMLCVKNPFEYFAGHHYPSESIIAQKVELYFRDAEPAQIGDLKIQYRGELTTSYKYHILK